MNTEMVNAWSKSVAILAVDALMDAGHITKNDFDSAVAVVAEEIFVRLTLGDYPPSDESQPESTETGQV